MLLRRLQLAILVNRSNLIKHTNKGINGVKSRNPFFLILYIYLRKSAILCAAATYNGRFTAANKRDKDINITSVF